MVRVGLFVLALFASAAVAESADYVRGHFRSNGTYVMPHYRSTRDYSFSNNWATYGNRNPYTGSYGTKRYPSSYSYRPYRYSW